MTSASWLPCSSIVLVPMWHLCATTTLFRDSSDRFGGAVRHIITRSSGVPDHPCQRSPRAEQQINCFSSGLSSDLFLLLPFSFLFLLLGTPDSPRVAHTCGSAQLPAHLCVAPILCRCRARQNSTVCLCGRAGQCPLFVEPLHWPIGRSHDRHERHKSLPLASAAGRSGRTFKLAIANRWPTKANKSMSIAHFLVCVCVTQ